MHRRECPGCLQQTNAQSQSGSAQFSYGCGNLARNVGSDGVNPAAADASVSKRVRIRVRNKKWSNGQGQGQIVQSDFPVQVPIAIGLGVPVDAELV